METHFDSEFQNVLQVSSQRQIRPSDDRASDGPENPDDPLQIAQPGIHFGDQRLHFDG